MQRVSVVITVRNEAANIRRLLDSLVGQGAHEVILVDAKSTDETVAIATTFTRQLPLTIMVEPCTRGRGRNIGAAAATGELLAFIDGDCEANPGWIQALAQAKRDAVLVGTTQFRGPQPAARVPIRVNDIDISAPSCNLGYPASLFAKLGGFDETFHTAEDMEFNLRAAQAGAAFVEVNNAIVMAETRGSLREHLKQAFSYGQGRAQLERKHPELGITSKRAALRGHKSLRGLARLAAGWLGYQTGKRK